MAHDEREIDDERVIRSVITIQRTPAETYAQWRDFAALPQVIRGLSSVTEDGAQSRWVIDTADGDSTWDINIVEDVPGELIRWESASNGSAALRGEVRFANALQGPATELFLTVGYFASGGMTGIPSAATLGKDPGLRMDTDLHRFKQLAEVGTIASTDGQPRGAQ